MVDPGIRILFPKLRQCPIRYVLTAVAAVFVVLIVGLPLYNMYWPNAASLPVLGFTRTWLFLGVAFFPITWLLSAYFVRESDRIESDAAKAVQSLKPTASASARVQAELPLTDKDLEEGSK